ncbi:MAG TPA: DNA-3-methyladenine glycosylase 2 family protein, partial [Streptomyces sp.]|nr:DNA-3-methyladenine glycosylase 2 family protein [Streptomyces sp.]
MAANFEGLTMTINLDADPEPSREDVYRPRHEVDVRATVRPLFFGDGDPTFHSTPDGFWRTVRTPDGPASLHVQMGAGADRGAFRIRTWGAGAEWARTSVPDLLGARDDWSGLDLSGHPRLAEIRHRHSGLRLTRTGLVFSALVAAILGQKTTGRQAAHSWRYLVARYGSAAPGPAPYGLRVMPSAREWNLIPSWAWHRAGVQPSQSRAAVAASRVAPSVDRMASLDADDERLSAGLRSIPGVGVWTVAETTQRSHG